MIGAVTGSAAPPVKSVTAQAPTKAEDPAVKPLPHASRRASVTSLFLSSASRFMISRHVDAAGPSTKM